MATVTVGCRLPHGLRLQIDGHADVVINGLNSAKIIGAEEVFTEVDEALWVKWHDKHKTGFAPLESGAIFVAKTEREAVAQAKDLRGKKTGFEPMPQEVDGVKVAKD